MHSAAKGVRTNGRREAMDLRLVEAAKPQPVIVVSRDDPDPLRALIIYVPLFSSSGVVKSLRHGRFV